MNYNRRVDFLSLFIVLSLAFTALTACPRLPQTPAKLKRFEADKSPEFLDDSVTFCRKDRSDPSPTRIQVLLDSSGSMIGFQPLMSDLVRWLQHSISLLRQSTLQLQASRTCLFNEGIGIGSCQELNDPLNSYSPGTDTNLHIAIRSSTEYDLTFLLTDGVAAAIAGGSGDCASGVDAACVARSFRNVISTQSLEAGVANWGLWVVPLVGFYSGPFYTEQKVNIAAFKTETTQDQVTGDFGGAAKVLNPRALSNGTMVFEYAGPREMLLIVLARQAELGREAVEALWDRAEHVGIQRLNELRSFSSPVAVMAPIEVYPGFVDHVRWQRLEPSDVVSPVGTIDAGLIPGEPASLRINCPRDETGERHFRLHGEVPRGTSVSGCVKIELLPAIGYSLEADIAAEATELLSFVPSYRRTAGKSYSQLDLHLACGPDANRTCDNPIVAEWRARLAYGKAADCLAELTCQERAPHRIRGLSTSRPSEEPHKIFGLVETLEEFLRMSASDSESQLISEIEICRGAP